MGPIRNITESSEKPISLYSAKYAFERRFGCFYFIIFSSKKCVFGSSIKVHFFSRLRRFTIVFVSKFSLSVRNQNTSNIPNKIKPLVAVFVRCANSASVYYHEIKPHVLLLEREVLKCGYIYSPRYFGTVYSFGRLRMLFRE